MSVSTNGQIGHSAGKDLTDGVKKSGTRNVPYKALSKSDGSITEKAPGKYGAPCADCSSGFLPTHKNGQSGSYGSGKVKPA